MQINGIKIIEHNADGVHIPDDPSYPYLLDLNCRPPQYMGVAFAFIHGGSETIKVRARTLGALSQFIESNGLHTHPRLRTLTINGPSGADLDEARARYAKSRH